MTADRSTIAIYDRDATVYDANRPPRFAPQAARFAEAVSDTTDVDGAGVVADLGCGPGGYLGSLGPTAIGVDASAGMLAVARSSGRPLVQADLSALPFRAGSVAGGWARNSYLHVAHHDLPLALADLHRTLPVGGRLCASFLVGRHEHVVSDDDLPGRNFWFWDTEALVRTVTGAGFDTIETTTVEPGNAVFVSAIRARTLPDTVGPQMRVLVCGLNPSIHAADAGVGFVTANNRFWPAAIAAGLASVDRDPWHAVHHHGMGMTDIVKRATRRADQLRREEYASGLDRLDHLVAGLRPGAVCMVGLAGWRAAVDRRATAGWQSQPLGGRPVYVMPSTSGLNAHASLGDLTEHLRTAAAGQR